MNGIPKVTVNIGNGNLNQTEQTDQEPNQADSPWFSDKFGKVPDKFEKLPEMVIFMKSSYFY